VAPPGAETTIALVDSQATEVSLATDDAGAAGGASARGVARVVNDASGSTRRNGRAARNAVRLLQLLYAEASGVHVPGAASVSGPRRWSSNSTRTACTEGGRDNPWRCRDNLGVERGCRSEE
jgi:hypothetical protein